MIYVVDLDDTLISSTKLNNDAYNFALEQYNFPRLLTNDRITRENLNFINNHILNAIINMKQRYFCQAWLPYRVVINNLLITKLKMNKNNCFLWTKADKSRADKIIELCNLDLYFRNIIYDDKTNFETSMNKLQLITNSNQFIIYENNKQFFEGQNCKIVDSIKDNLFDINGYLVNVPQKVG